MRRSTKAQQQSADLAYWLQRPMHERIAAVALAIIGLDDFAKRSSGRLKDLADLESLGLAGGSQTPPENGA